MYANSHVVCLVEVRFSVHEFAALSCKRICTDANHGSLELQTTSSAFVSGQEGSIRIKVELFCSWRGHPWWRKHTNLCIDFVGVIHSPGSDGGESLAARQQHFVESMQRLSPPCSTSCLPAQQEMSTSSGTGRGSWAAVDLGGPAEARWEEKHRWYSTCP